jgi:hypothetical protein
LYEFFSEEGYGDINLRDEYNDFSKFMTLCDSDPSVAAEQLLKAALSRTAGSNLVARYGKEVRRLRVDLRHERERRILAIRHDLESDFLEQPASIAVAGQISTLIEALVPDESTVAALEHLSLDRPNVAPTLAVNINQQFILKPVQGSIVQNVQGTIHLGPNAKELLSLIGRYGGDLAPALKSAVHELEDLDAPLADRRRAKRQLMAFLHRVGDGVQDVAKDLLVKYVETKTGI